MLVSTVQYSPHLLSHHAISFLLLSTSQYILSTLPQYSLQYSLQLVTNSMLVTAWRYYCRGVLRGVWGVCTRLVRRRRKEERRTPSSVEDYLSTLECLPDTTMLAPSMYSLCYHNASTWYSHPPCTVLSYLPYSTSYSATPLQLATTVC